MTEIRLPLEVARLVLDLAQLTEDVTDDERNARECLGYAIASADAADEVLRSVS